MTADCRNNNNNNKVKIKNKREMPCTLIGVAFPVDSYVTQLEAEKKQSYESVCV
jgi:hypothetical protein